MELEVTALQDGRYDCSVDLGRAYVYGWGSSVNEAQTKTLDELEKLAAQINALLRKHNRLV